MPDSKSSNLQTLAARVQANAALARETTVLASRVSQLRERVQQLSELCERAKLAARQQAALRSAAIEASVPKPQIRPRITALRTLEEKSATDIGALVNREAFNLPGLTEALQAAEDGLLARWQARIAPPKASASLESLDQSEVTKVVQQLKVARDGLQRLSATLPEKVSDMRAGLAQRKKFDDLWRQLAEAGLEAEVLAFLELTRTDRGAALTTVLEDAKVLKWLRQNQHAARFSVILANRAQIFKK